MQEIYYYHISSLSAINYLLSYVFVGNNKSGMKFHNFVLFFGKLLK